MAIDTQLTGMTGVYLAAAELSHRGFIVSPTSRSARGADLLVTDQSCQKAWSVQVKTNANKNAKMRSTWSLSESDRDFTSDSHLYVFVNLNGGDRPEYLVVESKKVATDMQCGSGTPPRCWFTKRAPFPTDEGWPLFGNPVSPPSRNAKS